MTETKSANVKTHLGNNEPGGLSEQVARKARELFEIARPCFHYAKPKTRDAAMFEQSETGRLLMNAMRKIATLASSEAPKDTRLEPRYHKPCGGQFIPSEAPTADQQDDWTKPLLRRRVAQNTWGNTDAVHECELVNPDGPAAVAKLRPTIAALERCVRLLKDNSPVSAGYAAAQAGDRALADLRRRA